LYHDCGFFSSSNPVAAADQSSLTLLYEYHRHLESVLLILSNLWRCLVGRKRCLKLPCQNIPIVADQSGYFDGLLCSVLSILARVDPDIPWAYVDLVFIGFNI
jgi:hypothetical protein